MGSGGSSMPKPPPPPSPEEVLRQNTELVNKRILSLERAMMMQQGRGPSQLISRPEAPRTATSMINPTNPYERNRAGIRFL